ncbi:MAG: universal stress protein [Candidatus Methanomethylophilaceae archaeon]|nr:universal stress protein [Candidatus Methanomethylophilaceae archaeon]MDY5872775.1 universal stress protein [Candidatus Methanomethylophilaceae archaeon]
MTVLMAYDGKPHTQKALDYALRYAKAFGETLYIMSVYPSKEWIAELDNIKSKMDEFVKDAEKSGVKAIAVTESGHPSETILDAAKRFECDTLIVGRSDKKTGLDRVVLGSVSNYVVNNAQCTVIVVE